MLEQEIEAWFESCLCCYLDPSPGQVPNLSCTQFPHLKMNLLGVMIAEDSLSSSIIQL